MKQIRSKPSDLPVYADCVRCGATMRLFGIEPHPVVGRTDLHTFECTRCDAVQTETVPRVVLTMMPRR